jgi:hypothetical protein
VVRKTLENVVALLAGKRQKGETYRAVIACNDWLLMGPGRSLRALWRQYSKIPQKAPNQPPTRSYNTLKKWSRRHNWQKRAKLYDAEQERLKIEQAQADIAEMNARHVSSSQATQSISAKVKFTLLKRLRDTPDELRSFSTEELLNLIVKLERIDEIAKREERQARGVPGWLLQLTTMTDEELMAKYANLVARVGGGGGDIEGEGPDAAEDTES